MPAPGTPLTAAGTIASPCTVGRDYSFGRRNGTSDAQRRTGLAMPTCSVLLVPGVAATRGRRTEP